MLLSLQSAVLHDIKLAWVTKTVLLPCWLGT